MNKEAILRPFYIVGNTVRAAENFLAPNGENIWRTLGRGAIDGATIGCCAGAIVKLGDPVIWTPVGLVTVLSEVILLRDHAIKREVNRDSSNAPKPPKSPMLPPGGST